MSFIKYQVWRAIYDNWKAYVTNYIWLFVHKWTGLAVYDYEGM